MLALKDVLVLGHCRRCGSARLITAFSGHPEAPKMEYSGLNPGWGLGVRGCGDGIAWDPANVLW